MGLPIFSLKIIYGVVGVLLVVLIVFIRVWTLSLIDLLLVWNSKYPPEMTLRKLSVALDCSFLLSPFWSHLWILYGPYHG